MAKMRSRTEALVNAYLNNYQNANATTVNKGQTAQQSAQSTGSAIMNATDKTLPVLTDYTADVLNGIVKSAGNAQSAAVSNFKLAKKQLEAEQKAAAKAAKSSGKSGSKKKSSSTDDSDLSSAAADALNESSGNSSSSTSSTSSSTSTNNSTSNRTQKKKLSEKLADAGKKAVAAAKNIPKNYQEVKNTRAKENAERTAAYKRGDITAEELSNSVSTSYNKAKTVSEVTKQYQRGEISESDYQNQVQALAKKELDAKKEKQEKETKKEAETLLNKLKTDANYRAELAQPGRKLTDAEVKAVNEYEKSSKNTGFSGLKRVFDLARNSDNLSEEEYAEKAAELNAELNQNSALRSKAQANGAGQNAQAFTAGVYDSVPFLRQAVDAMAETANAVYPEQQQLPMLSDTLDATKSYDPLAAGAGTMVGKGMQYNLFNTAMAGTPLAETMGQVGGKVASAASKVPVLGQFATPAVGEALGRILTDQTADTALDTIPSLVNDLQTYDDQQARMQNGEQVDNALTPGQIGLNTLGNIGQNFAFNALPEVGGAVLNRVKSVASGAAQDALKQAGDVVQDTPAKVRIENNTFDAYHPNDILSSAYSDDIFPGAVSDEAKAALQNSDNLPIDGRSAKAYNEVNGGVVNGELGAGVRADVSGIADGSASAELQPGNPGNGISGQAVEGGQNSAAGVLGRGVQGPDAESTQTVAEWAKSITGKGRQSVYTRRIENLYNQMQNGASRESLAEEAANIAAGLVKESDFAEPLDEATTELRKYFKDTPVRLDEKAAGDILYTSGLKSIQQYNFQNGTNFSLTKGIPYDTSMQELGEMGVGVNGSSVDDLLKAVDASNVKPLVDSDQAAAYSDYLRDRILDGPSNTPLDAEDFANWLDTQSFDTDAPDYVQRLLERDSLPMLNDTVEAVSERVPGVEPLLNGSESVPENAVGATSARYSTNKYVENKDYGNQAATRFGLDDAHREGLTFSEHQVWTDREAQHQALDDIGTYIQEAGGDVDKGLDNAMNALRKDTQWDKGESVTANNIRDRLRTEYMKTEPGTPEFYRQKARYDDWQSEISKQRSKVAQTMQSFTGDANARMHEVSNPIREKWETQHSVEASRIKKLSDELDKLKSEIAQRDLDDIANSDYLSGAVSGKNGKFPVHDNVKFPDGVRNAGDMDAEFGQMLKDNDIPTAEERIANFSDEDKEKYKQAAEDAYNDIVSRVRKLCDKNRVKIDDDGVKTIAGKIMNGDGTESYYNSLISQAAGISDLSIDEMEMVDKLYSQAAKMGDSKERYDLEAQAINIMAQHLPAKSWFERFDNIRYLAMLGNPTTHVRNLIGNVLMKGLSDTKDEVAAVMQLAVTPKDARTKAVFVPQDMKKAASEWIDGNAYAATLKDGGKYNLDYGLERARSTYGNSRFGQALQWLSDKNSNLLYKEDEIFVKMGATHSLSNILAARGYDASIFTKTDEASQEVLQDALELAIRDAQDVTFHANNALTKAFGKISHAGDKNGSIGDKLVYMAGNGLLPFAKTPANILKTAAEYNPVGATVQAVYRGAKHQGSAAVTDALAKGVVGSAVMGIGWWLADQGFITGKMGDDKDYQEMLGKQEYSVNIPGHGSYSLDWAAPSIVPLMMGANLSQGDYDLTDILDDPGKVAGQMGDILAVALDPVTNMSMLSSLNDTFDNIRYNDEDALGAVGTLTTNVLTNYAQQFYPTAFSKLARTLDSTRRSSYGGGDSATERNRNYLARSTLNKVPVLSMDSEPYIDQWGRETSSLDGTDDSALGIAGRAVYNFGSPGYISAENVTPVDEYIQTLYGNTNNKNVLPTKAGNYLTVDNNRVYMTPEEKTEYAKTSGQAAYDILDSLRQNQLFLKLPEDQQSELVQKAYSVAKTAGGVAAVGDGVSGTNSKEYQAYAQGGVPTLENYLLAKNAIDVAGDGSEESLKKADKTKVLLNQNMSSKELYDSYMLLYPKDEKLPTIYSQYGADAAKNWLRYISSADLDGNGNVSQKEAMAVLNQMSLTDQLRRAYYANTNKSANWQKSNPY